MLNKKNALDKNKIKRYSQVLLVHTDHTVRLVPLIFDYYIIHLLCENKKKTLKIVVLFVVSLKNVSLPKTLYFNSYHIAIMPRYHHRIKTKIKI